MILIKFIRKGAHYTWLINDNWVMVISFLLTMGIGVVFRRIKNSNKEIKMSNSRGGNFIDECIEPDSVYEVLDPALEIVIKQMLNLPPAFGPVVISVPVLILSYVVSQQPIKQITILGVSVFVDRVTNLGVKAAIGVSGGAVFFILPVGVVSLTGALLASAIAFNVGQGITNFECDHLVSKVIMERSSEGKAIGFLERPPENNPRVFIKDNEDIELYFPSPNKNEYCVSESKQKVEKSNLRTEQIYRKCDKEFVPLKERTKTLSDLKKQDSTENREKAAPYIKRYEDRRKRIMNKRQSVHRNEL
nr:hypothetical protein [Cylindrotheca closterium]ULD16250.1 hypothetical protein [Cylindrotheca closterium]